jgi:hypothetical protein
MILVENNNFTLSTDYIGNYELYSNLHNNSVYFQFECEKAPIEHSLYILENETFCDADSFFNGICAQEYFVQDLELQAAA